jgi:hypothetical protein
LQRLGSRRAKAASSKRRHAAEATTFVAFDCCSWGSMSMKFRCWGSGSLGRWHEDEDEDEGAEADRKDRYREKAATAKLGVEIAKP